MPVQLIYWLGEFNEVSTVMVVEQGIVTKKLGAKIADGEAKVVPDGDKPGAKRPNDYLQLETKLIAAAGPDVTRMHSERSRQDLLSSWTKRLNASDKRDKERGAWMPKRYCKQAQQFLPLQEEGQDGDRLRFSNPL